MIMSCTKRFSVDVGNIYLSHAHKYVATQRAVKKTVRYHYSIAKWIPTFTTGLIFLLQLTVHVR